VKDKRQIKVTKNKKKEKKRETTQNGFKERKEQESVGVPTNTTRKKKNA